MDEGGRGGREGRDGKRQGRQRTGVRDSRKQASKGSKLGGCMHRQHTQTAEEEGEGRVRARKVYIGSRVVIMQGPVQPFKGQSLASPGDHPVGVS